MGNLSGESREQNRKDKVTRFRSLTYARQLALLVNTLGSHLKFGLSSAFFDKIPVRILLDVLFRVFRFSKASFYALTSSFMTF